MSDNTRTVKIFGGRVLFLRHNRSVRLYWLWKKWDVQTAWPPIPQPTAEDLDYE